jgi:hypothetical protein
VLLEGGGVLLLFEDLKKLIAGYVEIKDGRYKVGVSFDEVL